MSHNCGLPRGAERGEEKRADLETPLYGDSIFDEKAHIPQEQPQGTKSKLADLGRALA